MPLLKKILVNLNIIACLGFLWTYQDLAQKTAHAAQVDALTENLILASTRINTLPEAEDHEQSVLLASDAYSDDTLCYAFNIFHEARGELRNGQVSVAQVTANRVGMRDSWKTVCDAVYAYAQFSWTLDKPYIDLSDPVEREAFRDALIIANRVDNGKELDLVAGATHYYNPDDADPDWADDFMKVAMIGSHLFMR